MVKRYANYYSILEYISDDMPPKIKVKKKKAKSAATDDFPELTPIPSSSTNSSKFIVISSSLENKNLRSYNPFLLKKAIDNISTQYSQSSFLRDGSLLLLCNNSAVAEKFVKCSFLVGGIPVKIQYHKTLNRSKGLIYNRSLLSLSEIEIVAGLKEYNVVGVHFMKKVVNGTAKPNGLILLTFESLSAPKEIRVGFEVHKVREFIPRPMKCFKCHLLGHTVKHCKSEVDLCKNCALPVHADTPCDRKFCVNCVSDSHTSSDSHCPKYLEAAEITKIMSQKKCSRSDANKIFLQQNPNCSFSSPSSFSNLFPSSSSQPTTTVPVIESSNAPSTDLSNGSTPPSQSPDSNHVVAISSSSINPVSSDSSSTSSTNTSPSISTALPFSSNNTTAISTPPAHSSHSSLSIPYGTPLPASTSTIPLTSPASEDPIVCSTDVPTKQPTACSNFKFAS